MGSASRIRVREVQEVLDEARTAAAEQELDADATRKFVVSLVLRARPDLEPAEAERIYRIDRGEDVPDDPAEVEKIAIELVDECGKWAPEIPEMYARLARERGELDVAERQEGLLRRVQTLLAFEERDLLEYDRKLQKLDRANDG